MNILAKRSGTYVAEPTKRAPALLQRSCHEVHASSAPLILVTLDDEKVVKEQTGALRREEDRRKAVQSALARLRKERRVGVVQTVCATKVAVLPLKSLRVLNFCAAPRLH